MAHKKVDILLVEDSSNDVELILHSLQRHLPLISIEVARDGEEALDVLFGQGALGSGGEQIVPRLVLLDLKLPKIDGMEVLEQIRRHPATATLPVVVLTSSREQRDIAASYRLHANSYIQKPVDFDKFQETVRQLGLYWLLVNETPLTNG
jgi:two-component system, response regulator